VAGAAVVTALTAATAGASAPPVETPAPHPTRLGTSPRPSTATGSSAATTPGRTGANTRPRTQFPGFVLDRGRYTAFEAPDPDVQLFPGGINNRGVIVGEYIRPGSESGFVRDRRGRFTVFDVPGAKGTEANRINDRGQIVGEYSQDTPIVNDSARVRAYLFDRGKLTRIDVPGAVGTTALGINNRAQVVGAYWLDDGTAHGYLWDRGRLVTIDAPDVPYTLPYGINNRGQIVGHLRIDTTLITDTAARGFLLAKGANGPFTPIRFPGAPRSVAYDLNDRGQIVGLYENPDAPDPQPTGTQPPMGRMA
jgi:uncharacterized membrane protein